MRLAQKPDFMSYGIKDAGDNVVFSNSLPSMEDGAGPFGDTVTINRNAVSGDQFTVTLYEFGI